MSFNSDGLVVLDTAVLYKQMGLRGIEAWQLAQASGLTEGTIRRIRRGYNRVRPTTMAKIHKGLLKFQILEGAELLLVAPKPDGNGHEVKDSPVAFEVHGAGDSDQPAAVRKPRRKLRALWPDEGTPPKFVGRWPVVVERPKNIAPVRTTSTEAMKEA